MKLTPFGKRVVQRGGADGYADDDLLLLELIAKAPGLDRSDLERCFVALRMEYGEEALRAIKSGHVAFEERPAGERTETKEGTDGEQ